MTVPLYAVLPGGIDDPAAPSGGNRYDRAVLDRLARPVRELLIPGAGARPDEPALAAALAAIPDGAPVLIDGLVGCAAPDLLAAHGRRLRLIVLVHLPLGDETGLDPAEADRLSRLEGRALHAATAVVVTSRGAAARVAALHGVEAAAVIPPGVDPAPAADPSPGGERLLCVASLTHRKGQDVLLAALAELDDLPWTCTFVGAGTPPPATPRTRSAGPPPATPRTRFTGPLTGDALDAAYADADLFVLPSRAETYGMVVTEALARALPVIATDVGGVREALGGTAHGRLIAPDDPQALAGALRDWLTDPGLRARWRAAAHARRATLTGWDETARRWNEVLHAWESSAPTG